MPAYLLSTAYLPPIAYFRYLAGDECCTIEQMEHYPKQTYRNRCVIAGPNRRQVLSIPVDKQSKAKVLTRDLRISYQESWQQWHWRSITAAYSNSPYFLYYGDAFFPFYHKSFSFLIDFNLQLLEKTLALLRLETSLELSTEYQARPSALIDLRDTIHPKKPDGISYPAYHQVFMDRNGFLPGLSIMDLLFNNGPASVAYIRSLPKLIH